MNDLITLLKHFLYRDVAYLVGGSIVMISFLYLFDRFDIVELPVAYYLLFAGLAYFVGYAVKDGFSLTPLVSNRVLNRRAEKRKADLPPFFVPGAMLVPAPVLEVVL
jgi:hypothetical protein